MSIVSCPKCGAKNRVDESAARQRRPVCGRCGEPLPTAPAAAGATDDHPLVVTDASFERDVLGAGPTPVVLDCWAPWCPPCRALAPTLDALAREAGGRYRVAKLIIDENPGVAGRFRVESIPTLLFFKDGRLADRIVGLAQKPAIAQRLAALA